MLISADREFSSSVYLSLGHAKLFRFLTIPPLHVRFLYIEGQSAVTERAIV